jgi:translation initiation factor 2 beta subunit (eIF-2beta)/eIF-5
MVLKIIFCYLSLFVKDLPIGVSMPIIIKCKKCGAIYHYGLAPVSVKPIIETLKYCRYCGSPIVEDIRKIEILLKILD